MHEFFDNDGFPVAMSHGGDDHQPGLRTGTLPAYQRAHEIGFRHFQVDVVLIGDGRLVSMHAVTGRKRRLEHLDLEQVIATVGHEVTAVDELVERFDDVRWNFEIKSKHALAALIDLIERYGLQRRCCVGAPFSTPILRRVRHRFPDIATCTSLREGSLIGRPLLPTRNRGGDTVQMWWPMILGDWMLRPARTRGQRFQVWTVNDVDRAARLLDLGATGLITDDHEELRDFLRQRNAWKEPT